MRVSVAVPLAHREMVALLLCEGEEEAQRETVAQPVALREPEAQALRVADTEGVMVGV